jgi:alpha-ketoglutarate-dependent taurine dioxygenase
MQMEPLPGATGKALGFGALVTGFSLADALRNRDSDNDAELLCAALRRHGLLLFRDQLLTPADELALAEFFASWVETRDLGFRTSYGDQQFRVPGHEAIRVIGNVVDEATGQLRAVLNKAGLHWHTDGTGITIFTAPRVDESLPEPRVTKFLCGYRAFELLNPQQQLVAQNALVRMGAANLTGSSQAHDTERGARMSANGCRQERGVDESLMTQADWFQSGSRQCSYRVNRSGLIGSSPRTCRSRCCCLERWMMEFTTMYGEVAM